MTPGRLARDLSAKAHRCLRDGPRHSLCQRCLIHRARNVLAKLPKNAKAEVKTEYTKLLGLKAFEAGSRIAALAPLRVGVPRSRQVPHHPRHSLTV